MNARSYDIKGALKRRLGGYVGGRIYTAYFMEAYLIPPSHKLTSNICRVENWANIKMYCTPYQYVSRVPWPYSGVYVETRRIRLIFFLVFLRIFHRTSVFLSVPN